MINLIWAMTKSGIIANNDQLPWNIKSEMQYFQALTNNKTVLMGSKTFLSIGKPLKNRYNIIITSEPDKYQKFVKQNCLISNDLDEIIKKYRKNCKNELWVIGGAKIYQQTFKNADFLYVSIIKEAKERFVGNLKFPIRDFSDFTEINQTDYPEFTAYIYQRKD